MAKQTVYPVGMLSVLLMKVHFDTNRSSELKCKQGSGYNMHLDVKQQNVL